MTTAVSIFCSNGSNAVVSVQDVALFQEGSVASDALKVMAEDGDNSALLVRFWIMCIPVLWRFIRAQLEFHTILSAGITVELFRVALFLLVDIEHPVSVLILL